MTAAKASAITTPTPAKTAGATGTAGSVAYFESLTVVPLNPASIPGTVEAEEFRDGGEGVGYHDTDPGNNGGFYRPNEGVDIDFSGAGGSDVYYVGWTKAGEWLSYVVNVTAAGEYKVSPMV